MKNLILGALLAAAIPSTVIAGSNAWYMTPEKQGECGEECYTAPTAWIDEASGNYSFGVTCDSLMVMGGAAMEVSEPPFSETNIAVDSRSLVRFSVENGLNDVYVRPASENTLSLSKVQAMLETGSTLYFNIAGQQSLEFTLSGSKTAIRSMSQSCKR